MKMSSLPKVRSLTSSSLRNTVVTLAIFAVSMASARLFFITGKRSIAAWICQLKKLKELEEENARLKRMYADLSLDDSY